MTQSMIFDANCGSEALPILKVPKLSQLRATATAAAPTAELLQMCKRVESAVKLPVFRIPACAFPFPLTLHLLPHLCPSVNHSNSPIYPWGGAYLTV